MRDLEYVKDAIKDRAGITENGETVTNDIYLEVSSVIDELSEQEHCDNVIGYGFRLTKILRGIEWPFKPLATFSAYRFIPRDCIFSENSSEADNEKFIDIIMENFEDSLRRVYKDKMTFRKDDTNDN